MGEELTIVGQCSGITEKPSGWTEFQIVVPGKQYPVKLATKSPQLITDARTIKDALATWTYNETESDNVNPNSGKPYVNRYLEKVEAGASASGDTAQPQAHHEPIHFADKDRLITRQTCLKVAGEVYSSEYAAINEVDLPLAVMKAAQRFEAWLYRDIEETPF